MQSGPVSQRTDLEDRRNPVARGGQPAASQFSGRLAKGAMPVFETFLDDRRRWLHTNVGRHDNRGNNVVTHRNCFPKSRTRAFFSGNTHGYKIFTDQGGFSGSAGPLTLRFTHYTIYTVPYLTYVDFGRLRAHFGLGGWQGTGLAWPAQPGQPGPASPGRPARASQPGPASLGCARPPWSDKK